MTITVAAVGRMKQGPERALWDDYVRRLTWPVALHEIEEKRKLPSPKLIAREAELMRGVLPEKAPLVALDSRGKTLDSPEFAKRMAGWMEQGGGHVAFAIGGADGLDPALVKEASFVLGFGALTWPHLLARVMLIEQIYRAQCILTNHPYHH